MKAYLAIIETPLGVWDSTATVCDGHEAEARAKLGARQKFLMQAVPPFMTKGLGYLVETYWNAARDNGCKLIVREIDINSEG